MLAVGLGGCERAGVQRDEGPRMIELAHDTIHLPAGVRLHDIEVRREAGGEFHPSSAVEATVGDVVRFRADDMAGHAIAFVGAQLQPPVRDYLERTGQLRGPPLITTGSSWVITLADAPPGEYPFHCSTHNAQGRLVVTARTE